MGQHACAVLTDVNTFGDPCFGTFKTLTVAMTCSVGGGASTCNMSNILTEPYRVLNGGRFSGRTVVWSPDPLVDFEWDSGVDSSKLQIFFDAPTDIYRYFFRHAAFAKK